MKWFYYFLVIVIPSHQCRERERESQESGKSEQGREEKLKFIKRLPIFLELNAIPFFQLSHTHIFLLFYFRFVLGDGFSIDSTRWASRVRVRDAYKSVFHSWVECEFDKSVVKRIFKSKLAEFVNNLERSAPTQTRDVPRATKRFNHRLGWVCMQHTVSLYFFLPLSPCHT